VQCISVPADIFLAVFRKFGMDSEKSEGSSNFMGEALKLSCVGPLSNWQKFHSLPGVKAGALRARRNSASIGPFSFSDGDAAGVVTV
jgi:hypothetical protein